MPRPPSNLRKHTLNLYEGDFDRIQMLFPDVGAGVVIRSVIRRFIVRIEDGTEVAPQDMEVDV